MKIRKILRCLSTEVVILALFASSFHAGPLQLGEEKPPTIRLDVNLVQLPLTVTDSHGRSVGGLPQQAFQVYVDDVLNPITAFYGDDAPITAGIVIDNSASMAAKTSEVISSAVAFANGSNPVDQLFVLHFNDRVRLGLPPGVPFTGNISMLKAAASDFHLGGTTALYDALIFAETQFRQAIYARKIILVITDGVDNSSKATLEDVRARTERIGVVVFAMGLFDATDSARGTPILTDLAMKTGGAAFFPKTISGAISASDQIAREIRQQYTLAFQGAEDGQFHRIRVAAKDSRYGPLQVHTLSGYFASKP